MRLAYYQSKEEKKKLQNEAKKLGEHTIHDDFVDEKGNPTNGQNGRLTFGKEGELEKSIERKFTGPGGDFFTEIYSVKTFNEIYPLMYDGYEKTTFEKLRKKLNVENENMPPTQLVNTNIHNIIFLL